MIGALVNLNLSEPDQAWLTATFARNRAVFGDLRMEADADDGDGDSGQGDNDGDGSSGDQGKKQFADMTPDEKVDYLQQRTRHLENALKGKSADPNNDVRALRKRLADAEKAAAEGRQLKESLEEAARTDAERAAIKAREEGVQAGRESALAEARTTYGKQLVETRLTAAATAKGMTPEALLTLAGKPERFLGDEGVDDTALEDFLGALPNAPAQQQTPARVPDLGGGRRLPANVDGLQRGEEMYARKHGTAKPA